MPTSAITLPKKKGRVPPALPLKTTADIEAVYQKLVIAHLRLRKDGVVLPELRKGPAGPYSAKALQLVFLRAHLGRLVSRQDISQFVRLHIPGAAVDQQARHLYRAGWDVRAGGRAHHEWEEGDVVPAGYNGLYSDRAPSPYFAKSQLTRLGRVAASNWTDIKAIWKNSCACCGKAKRQLEMGHLDPTQGKTLSNLLPMCVDCNNHALQDLIFNEKGRVKALNSPRFVLASRDEVQIAILKALYKRWGAKVLSGSPRR